MRSTKSVTEGSLSGFRERQRQYAEHHFVGVPHSFLTGNAEDFQSEIFKIKRPAFVPLRIVLSVVNFAVDLDDELCFRAVKVDDIWPDRMLLRKCNPSGFPFRPAQMRASASVSSLRNCRARACFFLNASRKVTLAGPRPPSSTCPSGCAPPPPHFNKMGRRIMSAPAAADGNAAAHRRRLRPSPGRAVRRLRSTRGSNRLPAGSSSISWAFRSASSSPSAAPG